MIDLEMFVNPRLSLATLDTYVPRVSILAALNKVSRHFFGTLIDVGCGQMPYRDLLLSLGNIDRYIGLDFENNTVYENIPDMTWDGISVSLPDNSVDCAMATELFEHCADPEIIMREIFRILRPGGILFLTVPFLWPLHDVPFDQYRYTPFALERHLSAAGFENISLRSMGGWDESLAQMIGLYARRGTLPRTHRFVLSLLVYPLICLLSRNAGKFREAGPQTEFTESSIMSGIWGVAYRPLIERVDSQNQ